MSQAQPKNLITFEKLTDGEIAIIEAIANRAVRSGVVSKFRKMTLIMDIGATHLNSVKLDLKKFLAAPEFDFAHDIGGIQTHINRATGELEDFFLPRCCAPTSEK